MVSRGRAFTRWQFNCIEVDKLISIMGLSHGLAVLVTVTGWVLLKKQILIGSFTFRNTTLTSTSLSTLGRGFDLAM